MRRSYRQSNKPKKNYANIVKSKSMSSLLPTMTTNSSPILPSSSATISSEKTCTNCHSLLQTVNNLIKKIDALEDKLALISTTNNNVANSNSIQPLAPPASHFNPEGFNEWKHHIEELIEARTNRQMRKTLVIRNIAEDDSEKSWQDTDAALSSVIAETLSDNSTKSDWDEDVDIETASLMIDRCHRGGNKDYYKREGKVRPIFAAMMCWKDCERIIQACRAKRNGVYIDYMYGPKTTKRRNLALQHRKALLEEDEIDQGYVSFPAKLMGRKHGDNSYKLIKDFSNEMV